MTKNLDGIKKLSRAELSKYHKNILSHTVKADSTPSGAAEKISQPGLFARRVDGLKPNKIFPFKPDDDLMPEEKARLKEAIKRQEEERRRVKEEDKRYRLKKEEAEKARRLGEKEKIKREELRKKEIIALAEQQARERARLEAAEKWEAKIKLERKEREKKTLAEENLRREKTERRREAEKIKQQNKIAARRAAEKRKVKRGKALKKFKIILKDKAGKVFYAVKRNFVFGFLFLLIFLAGVYVIFCLAVLRFKIDNNFTEKLSGYLPVPAAITSQGIINYDDFKNIQNVDYYGLSSEEKKNSLASWVILRNLKQKYGLVKASDDDLAEKFIRDEEFNRTGLARINKINSLLKTGGTLEQLGKYADEYGDSAYFSGKTEIKELRPAVLSLVVGQTSEVIFMADGYYIAQRIDDKNGWSGVNYLFVGGRTLNQYVSEKIGKTKVFILVNGADGRD